MSRAFRMPSTPLSAAVAVTGLAGIAKAGLVLAGMALAFSTLQAPAVLAQQGRTDLIWSLAQEPPNWNYWQVGATALTTPLFHNVLEPLVERMGDGSIRPLLAESWEKSADGLVYTFKIREAKFHDGSDLDAGDVVYSLLKNKESPVADTRAPMRVIAAAEAVDDRTVKVTLSVPSQRLLGELGLRAGIIVPDQFHETHDAATGVIGTGPYSFGDYRPDVDLKLNRFADYWGETPYFETITHRFIPDETAATNALLAGEIDMIATVQGDGLDRVESIAAGDGFDYWMPGPIGVNYLFLSTRAEALKDLRVRQAIAHAIPRDEMIAGAVGGFGTAICEIVVPASEPWNQNYCPYAFDPDRSRALLAEAGQAGLTLDFPFVTVAEHPAIKEIVEAYLADVGISVTPRPLDLASWLEQVNTNGQYQISNITASAKAESYICGAGREPLGRPNSEACVEQFDTLAKRSDSIIDQDEYRATMAEMVKVFAESAWVIPLFAKTPPTLVRADLDGFKGYRYLNEMDARTLRWAE